MQIRDNSHLTFDMKGGKILRSERAQAVSNTINSPWLKLVFEQLPVTWIAIAKHAKKIKKISSLTIDWLRNNGSPPPIIF